VKLFSKFFWSFTEFMNGFLAKKKKEFMNGCDHLKKLSSRLVAINERGRGQSFAAGGIGTLGVLVII